MSPSSKTPAGDSDAVARYRAICSKALLLPPGQQAQFLRDLDRNDDVEHHDFVQTNAKAAVVISPTTASTATSRTTQVNEVMEETRESASPGTASTTSTPTYQWIQCSFSTSPKQCADGTPSTPPAKRQKSAAAPQYSTGTAQNPIAEVADAPRERRPSAEQNPQTPGTIQTDPMSIHAVLERNCPSPE